ncbi:type VI secretion system tube protein Hcp [Pantoea sp. LS15]|uniref:type VI secretion system tube protein TssD n=1 Tax=Enterobacterales TaxID=91347 RepID=UPI000E0F3DFB|nr:MULTISPECIES: type VI secretion system tube protein TssD [Enterobacterales]MDV0597546.1 type VI secretion system tube protein TssD [Enterobacter sp. 23-M-SZ-13]NJQ20590.1 type VI secretion system tube protein Hcp [Pantoea sp. LS15]NKF47186.1 type VI secretion system tube protein Hcp [Pantoea sp. LS15]RDK13973.1 type VI secretion system tube protein Hcp [Enterobacter sp. 9-2]
MAVPVHLILKDDGGSQIMGSCDVQGRDGSIELRSLQHSLRIPTDHLTGKVTGTRQHYPFNFTKELDSSSPYLFKAAATGQTLQSAEFKFYRINYSGQEEEYYTITLEGVKVVSVSPVMHDTRNVTGTGHMEDVALSYEKITHLYKDGNILHSDAWNEKKQA